MIAAETVFIRECKQAKPVQRIGGIGITLQLQKACSARQKGGIRLCRCGSLEEHPLIFHGFERTLLCTSGKYCEAEYEYDTEPSQMFHL